MNLAIRIVICGTFGFLVSNLPWERALSLMALLTLYGVACMWVKTK